MYTPNRESFLQTTSRNTAKVNSSFAIYTSGLRHLKLDYICELLRYLTDGENVPMYLVKYRMTEQDIYKKENRMVQTVTYQQMSK